MSQVPNIVITPKRFQFVGGELCLDFTNTVGGTRGPTGREYLKSYGDFLSWCGQAGLSDPSATGTLARGAARRLDEAGTAFRRAIALRESLYRIFAASAHHKSPEASDLDRLNRELSAGLVRLRVASGKQGFEWTWAPEDDALDQALGPIARSAANLLTSPHLLERVRQCRGDDCGWLFLDSTKNHSRCWCVMSDCGNVAKVRRFRQRHRGAQRRK
jgi:predicted RNA-binding Zn ribbon-like protein